jgi:hypothetical protein
MYGFDPLSAEGDSGADGNPDGDDLTNLQEYLLCRDPHTPDFDGFDVSNSTPGTQSRRWTVDCGKNLVEITIHPADPAATITHNGVEGNTFTVSDLRPGVTRVEYTMTGIDGIPRNRYIELEKWFEFDDMVTAMWNSVLAVNNSPETNAKDGIGYKFRDNSYQWYLNGNMLSGKNKQFYATPNNADLNPADEYYVTMITEDEGLEMRTCPGHPHWETQDVSHLLTVAPNPAAQGRDIRIKVEGNKNFDAGKYVDARIYTVSGQFVKYVRLTAPETVVNLDLPIGIYVIKVDNENVKIVIQ